MNSFLRMQKTDFHDFELFAEKSFRSLNAQNHFFKLLRTPILCFSATKANYENARPTDAQKLFLSEKKWQMQF